MLGAKSKPSKPNSSWQCDNLAFLFPHRKTEQSKPYTDVLVLIIVLSLIGLYARLQHHTYIQPSTV